MQAIRRAICALWTKASESQSASTNSKSLMKGLNVAVLGCGHWGPNYIRVFLNLENVVVKYACDLSQQKLDRIKTQFPNVQVTQDVNVLLKDPALDAVVIATPSSTHFAVAKSFLEAGKNGSPFPERRILYSSSIAWCSSGRIRPSRNPGVAWDVLLRIIVGRAEVEQVF